MVIAILLALIALSGVVRVWLQGDISNLMLLLPLGVLIIVIAPYQIWKQQRDRVIKLEEEKKPRLSVHKTYKEKYSSTDCSRVGLVIRNEGTGALNNCHARLVGIDFETPSSASSYGGVPINKDIPCDSIIGGKSYGKAQAMTCHGLLGQERAIIEYLDETSRGIFLGWRQPILLLLHLWGENSKLIYAVCKVSKQTIGLDICVLESAPLQHDIKLSDFQTITPDK